MTDALGRRMPNFEDCGPIKKDRYVGMFYFINHTNPNNSGPFNVTEILEKNPDNPKWGNGSHFWAEPELGYYINNEGWVIRKRAYQLSDAGVDVIINETSKKTSLKKYNSEKGWIEISKLPLKISEKEIMLAIPQKLLNSKDFDFHWVDNPKKLKDITDFFDAGDNAPERRADYRFMNK